MDTSHLKNRMVQQYFPFSADLSPQRLPPDYYKAVSDLELIDLYSMDMGVANEETWLTGEQIPPRRLVSTVRSSSMDSINEMFFLDHSEFSAPFHSTPQGKDVVVQKEQVGLNGGGDGVRIGMGVPPNVLSQQFHNISPIASPMSKQEESAVPNGPPVKTPNLRRTYMLRPVDNDSKPDGEERNGTFSKESSEDIANKTFGQDQLAKVVAPVKPTIPTAKQPVKANRQPPKAGLRAPGPPVTGKATANSGMNRATSLGNISGTEKKLAVSNGLPAAPGRTGSNPALKIPVQLLSKIPRPPTRLPAPSAVPSRIPKPGAKK